MPGPGRPGPGKAPGGALSNAPGATGQVKEVTKGMVEALRTNKVDFDEETVTDEDCVILLNPRKLRPEASKLEREHKSSTAGGSAAIAQPL